jgi:hypothetical protein
VFRKKQIGYNFTTNSKMMVRISRRQQQLINRQQYPIPKQGCYNYVEVSQKI